MNAVTTPRAGRREWIGLAVIALPHLPYSMDLTVLFLAVPQLSAALQPSSTQLLRIMLRGKVGVVKVSKAALAKAQEGS